MTNFKTPEKRVLNLPKITCRVSCTIFPRVGSDDRPELLLTYVSRHCKGKKLHLRGLNTRDKRGPRENASPHTGLPGPATHGPPHTARTPGLLLSSGDARQPQEQRTLSPLTLLAHHGGPNHNKQPLPGPPRN